MDKCKVLSGACVCGADDWQKCHGNQVSDHIFQHTPPCGADATETIDVVTSHLSSPFQAARQGVVRRIAYCPEHAKVVQADQERRRNAQWESS